MGYVIAAGTIIGLSVISALVGRSLAKAAPTTMAPPTPERLERAIIVFADKSADHFARKNAHIEGQAIALALGLPKTAAAIKSETRLPADETWPGTNQSVFAYMTEKFKAAGGA